MTPQSPPQPNRMREIIKDKGHTMTHAGKIMGYSQASICRITSGYGEYKMCPYKWHYYINTSH